VYPPGASTVSIVQVRRIPQIVWSGLCHDKRGTHYQYGAGCDVGSIGASAAHNARYDGAARSEVPPEDIAQTPGSRQCAEPSRGYPESKTVPMEK